MLDGDLLAIMEALYREVTARRASSDRSRTCSGKSAPDRPDGPKTNGALLSESLFLNTVKYENDKLEAYMRKLEQSR